MKRNIGKELLDDIAAIKAENGKETSMEIPENVRDVKKKPA